MKRIIILLLSFFALNAYSVSSSVPHASIIKWVKGSYGNYSGAAYREKISPLPIWISISFDKPVNEEFVNNYFKFLVGHHPMKNKRYGHIYTVTVSANTSRSEFEGKIDKVNRHFDPEIEKQEQLAIEETKAQAERQAVALAVAEAEAARKAEEERLRLEAEKKAQEERRAIAKAKAEEAARILAIQREQERIEAERKQKAIEQEEQLKESSLYSYSITKLPKDFHILGGYYAFNNRGQVVGCISKKATIWLPIYQIGRRPVTDHLNSREDRYADAVAACWEQESGLHIFNEQDKVSIAKAINDDGLIVVSLGNKSQKKQCALWDIATEKSRLGPLGDPYFITNTNIVIVMDGSSSIIWNSDNNIVLRDNNPHLYMTIDGKMHYDHYLMMNKKGSAIRIRENSVLQSGTNNYLLLPEGNSRILALNDNDQIAALVDIKWGTKIFKAIQILDKNGNSLRSRAIKELVGYSQIAVIGFNIRGQLLLSADNDYLFLNPNGGAIA